MSKDIKYRSGFRTTWFRYITVAMLLIMYVNVHAQKTAVDWFNRGRASQDVNDKIDCYLQAIEMDSSFVEAYYNLGLAFKSIGRLTEAQQILKKVNVSYSSLLNEDLKIKVGYELGITNKRLGRYIEAKDALNAVVDLTSESKANSQIIYEIGRVCMLLEDYDEAIRQFNLGLTLAPEKTSNFEDAIRSAQQFKEVSMIYSQGKLFFDSGRYQEAATEFEKVIQIDPNYKDSRIRFTQSQNEHIKNQRSQEVEQYYRQGLSQMRLQDWAAANQSFQKVLSLNPDYKDVRTRINEAQLARDMVTRNESIELQYNEGLSAMRSRNWTKAVIAFDRVREMEPDYKDVEKLIRDVQIAMDRESAEATKTHYYNLGIMAVNNEDYNTALSAFRSVTALDPNYHDVQDRLAEVESILDQAGSWDDAAMLYSQGVEELSKGEWLNAVIAFEKVKSLDPNYQDVAKKLARAKTALAQGSIEPINKNSSQINPLTVIGLIGLIVFLLIVCMYIFSPTLRARIFLLRHRYQKAIRIYERLLERNPGRIKLYLLLTTPYLLENRKDEKAVRIYEMVLRLNLRTKHRDVLTTIVANHYLREGRTDEEALQLMERALSSELSRGYQ